MNHIQPLANRHLLSSAGFTLVEMAVVLVIIGLLLGGVMKGQTLIESAKVNSESSRIDRINAAINLFFERYGRYPGDGCNNNVCGNNGAGGKDGLFGAGIEANAAWYELIDKTRILKQADRASIFGQDWNFWNSNRWGGGTTTGLDLPGGNQVKASYFCQMDRQKDDGDSTTGDYQATLAYNNDSDCWSEAGRIDAWIRLNY
jgi:prepilin-type N-terminal cleavage/methylation domain-containing protein